MYKRWFREYYNLDPSVRISYQGLGSGAGIRQFTAGLVDFGASDSAMTPKEIKQVPEWGVQLLPMTSGCVVLAYNVPDVSSNMDQARRVADKTAFYYVDTKAGRTGYLVEYGDTTQIFDQPKEVLTKEYVSGQFS